MRSKGVHIIKPSVEFYSARKPARYLAGFLVRAGFIICTIPVRGPGGEEASVNDMGTAAGKLLIDLFSKRSREPAAAPEGRG